MASSLVGSIDVTLRVYTTFAPVSIENGFFFLGKSRQKPYSYGKSAVRKVGGDIVALTRIGGF
jgi:hypothetical protein